MPVGRASAKGGFAVDDEIKTITAHYVKSPHFDEHPMHGIYGGLTAGNQIAMAVYSERMAIPQQMEIDLAQVEGQGFQMISERAQGKDGAVRFVHGVYYFDVEMAKAMVVWLADKIQAAEGGQNAG